MHLLLAVLAILPAASVADFTTWSAYLGGPDSTQYSALKQINKASVKQLEVAWTYATGEKVNYLFNPSVATGDGMMTTRFAASKEIPPSGGRLIHRVRVA
jgi:hypothetical protein